MLEPVACWCSSAAERLWTQACAKDWQCLRSRGRRPPCFRSFQRRPARAVTKSPRRASSTMILRTTCRPSGDPASAKAPPEVTTDRMFVDGEAKGMWARQPTPTALQDYISAEELEYVIGEFETAGWNGGLNWVGVILYHLKHSNLRDLCACRFGLRGGTACCVVPTV